MFLSLFPTKGFPEIPGNLNYLLMFRKYALKNWLETLYKHKMSIVDLPAGLSGCPVDVGRPEVIPVRSSAQAGRLLPKEFSDLLPGKCKAGASILQSELGLRAEASMCGASLCLNPLFSVQPPCSPAFCRVSRE